MRFDGEPIWTHDMECGPDHPCATCEAEITERLEQDEQDELRLAFEAQAAEEEAA